MSTDICDEVNKITWGSISKHKKECRKHQEQCIFNNKLGRCTKIILADELETARELDFNRTYTEQEQLVKNMNYRQIINSKFINDLKVNSHNYGRFPSVDNNNFIKDLPPCDFGDIINYTKYLGSGTYGHAFQICPDDKCEPEFVLKLIPYQVPNDNSLPDTDYTKLDVTNTLRGENVEVLQPSYLRRMLIPRYDRIISPHISLPIVAFRCNYINDNIQNLIKQVERRNPEKYSTTRDIYQTKTSKPTVHKSQYVNPDKAKLEIGHRISVRWEGDLWYHGSVSNYDQDTGHHTITYDDGDIRKYDLDKKGWKLVDNIYNPKHEILVFISEYAGNGDANDWLENSNPSKYEVTIFLFQLIYTYACIQSIDPTYRHNDLSLPNVLLQKIYVPDEYKGHYYHYQFKNRHYLIPITNFSLRLWDMDFSNSHSVPNRKVFCGPSQDSNQDLAESQKCSRVINDFSEHGIIKENCLQYDLCFFFSYLKTYNSYYRGLSRSSSLKHYIDSWRKFSRYDDSEIIKGSRLTERAQKIYLSKDNTLPESQQLITICRRHGKSINMPYYRFTAEHSLTHCDIFKHYEITEERLMEVTSAGLILADYVFT